MPLVIGVACGLCDVGAHLLEGHRDFLGRRRVLAASLLVFSGISDRDAALAAKRESAVLISLTPGSQLAEHVEQIV